MTSGLAPRIRPGAACLAPLLAAAALAGPFAAPAAAAWLPNGNPVSAVAGIQSSPRITSDGAGGAVVVWTDSRTGASDIYAQRVDGSGTMLWSANGIAVTSATGSQSAPGCLPDGANGAFVAWRDPRAGGLGDVYAQRINAAGIPLWTVGGIALGSHTDDDGAPQLASNLSNGVAAPFAYYVAWLQTLAAGTGESVRIQTVRLDGTGLWTASGTGGVEVTPGGSGKSDLRIVTDGVGTLTQPKGALLVWVEESTADDHDVRGRRVTWEGVPQGGAGGFPICTAPGLQVNVEVANVGGDQAIVAWVDLRDGSGDIYAQKVNSAGTALWLADGLPVCRAVGDQLNLQVLRDGAGGAFLVWTDSREEAGQLYGQRIDANGSPLWGVDGIPLAPASRLAHAGALLPDGSGGFLVAWSDSRNGGGDDIYAQRVDGAGNPQWGPDGTPLSVAAGQQFGARIVSDGAQGALVAWGDNRSGSLDVYATRVLASGGVVSAPPADFVPSGGVRLALASANPSRGGARFSLHLEAATSVRLEVADVAGRCVRVLAPGVPYAAGTHRFDWDGRSDAGRSVAAGVYYVRLRAEGQEQVERVTILR